MRASTSLALALAASANAISNANADLSSPNNGAVLPGAYIVEFMPGQDNADAFYSTLTSSGIEAEHRQTFQPNVFSGTSFRLLADKQTDLDVIGNLTQVKKVSPVRLYSLAAPKNRFQNVNWEKVAREVRAGKRQTSTANDTITTHVMTGVDKLHADGLDGTGIKVAVIDTGVDYSLKALGGGFGPGFKVAFGTDLVGDNYTGYNTPVPDDDPMDCNGHGTHVAGIVAASNDPYILGAAPGATLGAYRVFGCEGEAANDVLIQAFTQAFNDGADIITASIGGPSGWPEEPWSAATNAIVEAGTPCMLAAGNDGANGLFYGSTAASGIDVTAVGSVDNSHAPSVLTAGSYSVAGANSSFGYTPATGSFAGVSLPLWTSSTTTTITDDGCNPFTADLTGKIALIRRGTCTFTLKAQNAVSAGAHYVMFYNNVPGTIAASVSADGLLGAGMVDPDTGATWVNALAGGQEVVLTFPTETSLYIVSPGPVNTATGGFMSTFSSWYPTQEGDIKPVVSAPGGNVLSSYPSAKGSYAVLSGTSMATPFIAGVVALYKQAKGSIVPKELNAALASTAKPLNFNDGGNTYEFLAPAIQQGGGLVDAYKLINTPVLVDVESLPLNDTEHFNSNTSFYITNTGDDSTTITLTHSPSSNAYSFNTAEDAIVATFPPPQDTEYSTAVITPSTLTLAPGAKELVTVAITPAALDASLIPVYSGYISISTGTSNTSSLSVPYAGIAAALHDITILEPGKSYPTLSTALATNSSSTPSYSNVSASFKPSASSYPQLIFNNRWGSAEIRVDVVCADNKTNDHETADGLLTVGSVPGYPLTWVARGVANANLTVPWNGTLADGEAVDSGVYKLVLRFLRVFGEAGDYETYDSESFYMDMS